MITPDVGGGFGAKFGADAEHVVVAVAARHVGRPVRWVETRSENMVAMAHGRAQVQHVTIGGNRDGTIAGLPARRAAGQRRLPADRRVAARADPLMAPGVYDIPSVELGARSVVTNTTPIGAYRGAGRPGGHRGHRAGDRPVRRRDRHGPGRGAPAQPARPRVPEPHDHGRGAIYDTGDYAGGPRPRARGRRLRRRCAPSRRSAASAATPCSSASACRVYVEITGAARGGRPSETRRSRSTPDGSATVLTGTSPHGQGHAPAWAMLASERAGIPIERITVVHGDTDLVPDGGGTGGSRSLQHRRRGRAPGRRRAGRAGRGSAAAELLEADPDDIVLDTGARRASTVAGDARPRRSPGPSWRQRRSGCSCRQRLHRAGRHVPVRRPRGGRRGRHRDRARPSCGGWSPSTTPARSSTRCSPRASATAAWPRARRRRCSRRSATTTTATRSTANFADYAVHLGRPSCRRSSWCTMETPTRYNPLGAKGIGEAGHDRRHPGRAERGDRRPSPPRRPPHRHARHTAAGVAKRNQPGHEEARQTTGAASDAGQTSPSTARRAVDEIEDRLLLSPLPARRVRADRPPTSDATRPTAGRAPSFSTVFP